ncbi:MAG: RHS repeat-associated core domain-containing protein, partial [Bacteroidota bacterium]
ETVRMANTAQNFLFNGGSELNKITNIYETQFRSYDPAIGRFEQIDPYASSFFELNPYQYAFNNPILFNDPSGLYPKQEFGSGTRLAECPSCPDSEEYDQYRDDHENFYEYDPETGEVNHVGTLLKEVVVEGEDQSEKTITQKYGAPIIGSGADDAPFGRVQSKYKLPTIDYAKLMEILELITRPFAREKTKPKDWKDKMKDSKDAIEKVQKVEKEIEDMKRGQQEEKKALNAKDYPPYPTGVVLPYQSSDSIPGTDSLRAFNIYEKIGGRYRKVGTDTLRIK